MMKTTIFTVFALLASFACFPAFAQSKKAPGLADGSDYIKLAECSSQRTLPGAPGSKPIDQFHLIIEWKSKQAPATFFWRGNDGWAGCNVLKITNYKKEATFHKTQEAKLDKIKKGDILEIIPVPGGKYRIPDEIPPSATNTLFFKTEKSNWLSFPVKNITRKKDIVMP